MRMHLSRSLLKCILTNYEEQTVILHNYVYEKYTIFALARGKTIN